MNRIWIREPSTDDLGRVIPGIELGPTVAAIADGWKDAREVSGLLQIAAHHHSRHAYDAIVAAAAAVGITHGPPDLAGHRVQFGAWLDAP